MEQGMKLKHPHWGAEKGSNQQTYMQLGTKGWGLKGKLSVTKDIVKISHTQTLIFMLRSEKDMRTHIHTHEGFSKNLMRMTSHIVIA